MTEEMIGKIVPVEIVGLEKKAFRDNGMFLGNGENRATYSINVLYENTFDPTDNVHKLALLPENPIFIKIKKMLDESELELSDYPLENLSKSLHDMYGAWVNIDLSKTPVCRVYTENVSKLVDGKPVVVHKAGDPIKKKDPKTGEDTDDVAIITSLPVWGFCRPTKEGKWIWMKDNDPMIRIQREINQGRLRYVEIDKPEPIKDGPDTEEHTEENGGEAKKRDIPNVDASVIQGVG